MPKMPNVCLLCGLLIILSLHSGCNAKREDLNLCDRLVDKTFPEFPSSDQDEVWQAWIQGHYGVEYKDQKKEVYPIENFHVWIWSAHERTYSGAQTSQGKRITVRWDQLKPTLGDAISCFGQPDYYQAYADFSVDSYYLRLTLWYPKIGVIANVERYIGDPHKIKFDSTLALSELVIVPAGRIESVYANFYSNRKYDEKLSKNALKVWTGTFDKIEILDNSPTQ